MLRYLDRLCQLDKLTLKELALKTRVLLALTRGQRGHALHALKTSDVKMCDCRCVLNFASVLKTTKLDIHKVFEETK